MYRVHQAIKRDPAAWTAYYNAFIKRECGVEGEGWSAAIYGHRCIDFGKAVDCEHAFFMVAEIHRLLMAKEHAMALAFA